MRGRRGLLSLLLGAGHRVREGGPGDGGCRAGPGVPAIPIIVPWSSGAEGDLVVDESHRCEWFSLEAVAGDRIALRLEAQVPGPGIVVRIYGPGSIQRPLAEKRTGQKGRLTLSAKATATGTQSLQVELASGSGGDRQPYALRVDEPRLVWEVDQNPRPPRHFEDAPRWHPYFEAIEELTACGVIAARRSNSGWDFRPDGTMSVADFARVVGACLHVSGPTAGAALSVRAQNASRPAGVPRREAVTRSLAVSTIVRALEKNRPSLLVPPPADFVTALPQSRGEHYEPDVAIAEHNGLLTGLVGFGPYWDLSRRATRGEIAQMLWAMRRLAGEDPLGPATASIASEPSMRRTGGRAANPKPHPPDWTSIGVRAPEFVDRANKELESLIEATATDGAGSTSTPQEPTQAEASAAVDPDAIRRRIEETRVRLKAGLPHPAGDAGPEGAPELERPHPDRPAV